ncbi:flagellar protein FlgN [Paenibacillus sp. PL2-23]|uniref:flagellar protein FlgN n=1 Tax=Paenibacillus sp. PL2-23 TaxID=2100729 RepID=UPI0030F8A3D1
MSVAAIIETLQRQLELYKKLLECEESKKALILKNEIVQLNVVTQKEKLLTAHAEEIETSRMLLTAKHFKNLGFRNLSGVLSDLIKSVNNAEEKKVLLELHGQLTDVLNRLKQVNEINQKLIQQSLDFINFSLGLIVENPSEDMVYQHPQHQSYSNKRNWYDSKV